MNHSFLKRSHYRAKLGSLEASLKPIQQIQFMSFGHCLVHQIWPFIEKHEIKPSWVLVLAQYLSLRLRSGFIMLKLEKKNQIWNPRQRLRRTNSLL